MSSKRPSLLWRISSKDDGSQPSYLLGTVHLGHPRILDWANSLLPYFDNVDVYLGELDLNDPALLNSDHIYIPNNQRLSDLIAKGTFNRIQRAVKKHFSLDILDMDTLLPFLILNQIGVKALGETAVTSLDHFLWTHAQAMDLPCFGLESGEEQIDILKNLDLKDQLLHLKSALQNISKYKRKVHAMLEDYLNQDIDALYKKASQDMGKFRQLLIVKRNRIMTERLIEHTKRNRVFCALGAGHLAGYHGMLRLLKKSGYVVQPLHPTSV